MARAGLDQDIVVEATAKMTNKIGIENITMKMIAEELGVQTPSLYNHIKGMDDLKRKIMIYGWKQMEQRLIQAVAGVSGEDALRAMCNEFYDYATSNPGIFNVMLWYNKFQDEESMDATAGLFCILIRIMGTMNITLETANHLIRTFRSFLEGYCLLQNNGAFGNPISMKESFDISVDVVLAGIKTMVEK